MTILSSDSPYWDRDQLYRDVWSQPLTSLMTKYHVSAVAIGKTCRKLQVPLPGRGYWAKKAHGHPVVQMPLPKVHEVRKVLRYQPPPVSEPAAPADPKPEFPVEAEDRKDIESIDQMLTSGRFAVKKPRKALQHALIVAARDVLRQGFASKGILVAPRDERCLDIRVSKASLSRALTVFAGIIAVLEDQGMKVEVVMEDRSWGNHSWETAARIFGERIRFGLTERMRQNKIPDPRAMPLATGRPRCMTQYEPTGELSIHIRNSTSYFQTTWHDTEQVKIESMVPEFVAGMMKAGVECRRQTLIRRQEQFFRRLDWEELGRLKGQIDAEEARIQRLEKNAENWHRARRIREYTLAVIKKRCGEGRELNPKTALGRWATWALEQADRIDPLAARPQSIVDRKGELERWSPYGLK
jgi:hypothetical protein